MATPTAAFGLNLIGFASANLGHGVALRNTAAILMGRGIPFRVLDIDPGGGRTGHDLSLAGHFAGRGETLPFPVNVFHVNPPTVPDILRDLPGWIPTEGRMNVSVPFWELPSLPPSWTRILETMDLVLAPSRFVEAAALAALRTTEVIYYAQALALPEAKPDRARWGFPPGRVVFLSSFDINSGILRKHPLAAIEAFRRAFPDGRASLVIKVNNPGLIPEAAAVIDRLKAVAASAPGVLILDRAMPYADALSLYASADVIVSLHRSEGLGLSLMEGMALGKPVVATAWSGNMDFMDDTNSCLVPYTLVPVEKGSRYHEACEGVPQVWAEPSVEAAAAWMARLAASAELRREIGARAQSSIAAFREASARGGAFTELRARFESDFPPGRRQAQK